MKPLNLNKAHADMSAINEALDTKKAAQQAARDEWAETDKKLDTVKGLKARVEAIEKLLGLGEK